MIGKITMVTTSRDETRRRRQGRMTRRRGETRRRRQDETK